MSEANEIWNELVKLAEEDGVISKDEDDLMKSILSDLGEYTSTLEKAQSDGKIDVHEFKELREFRANIVKKAIKKAKLDDKITKDELRIIHKLQQIFLKL